MLLAMQVSSAYGVHPMVRSISYSLVCPQSQPGRMACGPSILLVHLLHTPCSLAPRSSSSSRSSIKVRLFRKPDARRSVYHPVDLCLLEIRKARLTDLDSAYQILDLSTKTYRPEQHTGVLLSNKTVQSCTATTGISPARRQRLD